MENLIIARENHRLRVQATESVHLQSAEKIDMSVILCPFVLVVVLLQGNESFLFIWKDVENFSVIIL